MTSRMPGAQHLDHDFRRRSSRWRHAPARWRRRPEALDSKLPKTSRQRQAEGFLDHRDGEIAGKGRHAVLQFRQLIGDVDWQQIAARRQRLAEFHEYRAQLLERQAQPLAARAADAALEPGPGRKIEQEAQRPIQMGARARIRPAGA